MRVDVVKSGMAEFDSGASRHHFPGAYKVPIRPAALSLTQFARLGTSQ
jgi:hypothetical protein